MADAAVRRVLTIGDSITNEVVSFGTLSSHTVTNVAVDGTLTSTWVSRSYFDTQCSGNLVQAEIDVVHIQLCTNDAAQLKGVKETINNLRTIIGYVRDYGNFDILIGIPPRFAHLSDLSVINLHLQAMILRIRDEVIGRDVNVRVGLDWMDFSQGWAFTGPLWDDFTHPSAAGHALAAPYFDAAVYAPKKTVVPAADRFSESNGKTYRFSKITYDGTETPFKVVGSTTGASVVLPVTGAPTATLGDVDPDLDRTVTLAAGSPAGEVTVVTTNSV